MRRPREQLLRRADLADHAVLQHHDAVGQRQRLLLVVRDVDRGGAERRVDAADLGPHLEPQLGVEVGERLVHQHQRRLDHDGARDRHALLLAAGELARQLVLLALQPHEGDRLVDAARRLGLRRRRCIIRPKPTLRRTRHVREQGVVLEHHAEAALLRPQRVDAPVVEPDPAAGRRQQPGDAVQRGRLAAAGRAEQGDELALLDGQRHVAQRVDDAELAAQPVEPQFLEVGGVDASLGLLRADLLVPNAERLHHRVRRPAAGRSACRRSASRIPAGRRSAMTSWLAFGAIDRVTPCTAGPG